MMFPRGVTGNYSMGELSSKWLVGAISIIGSRPELLERIFGSEYNANWQETGCLVVQIFKDYCWQEILVDTTLPGDIAASNLELWAGLLEKAFAKVMGGYEVVQETFARNGIKAFEKVMVELTGGCVESYDSRIEWSILKKRFQSGALVTCALLLPAGEEEVSSGILPNHPYSVLDVLDEGLPDSLRLVRLRNPWNSDWTGQFSSTDHTSWNKYTELRDTLQQSDGTFWMPYKFFIQHFNHFSVNRLFPRDYYQYHLEGIWDEQKGYLVTDVEFCGNPQYRLSITKPTTLFISLCQLEKKMTDINLILFRSKGQSYLWEFTGEPIAQPVEQSEPQREMNLEVVVNPEEHGTHFILVVYQNTQKPDCPKPYCLRVFANNPANVEQAPKPFCYRFPVEFTKNNSAGKRQKQDPNKPGAILDNTQWCRNPQIFLALKKPSNLKICLERIVGRRKQADVQIGGTVCRLFPSSQPDRGLGPVKKGRLPQQSSQVADLLGEKILRRKLQILPNDWLKEAPYADDATSVTVNVSPAQGPIVIIPSLSEEGLVGNSQLTIYSDKELHQAIRLPEQFHPTLCSEWTPDAAGGCHIYYAPYEPPKTATWGKNPRMYLSMKGRSQQTCVTLARCERQWRQQIAKDAVGCMLGFYIMKLQHDAHRNEVTSRELVVAETTFCPSHEVTLESVALEAENYVIMPCTYDPGKVGEYILYVTSDTKFDLSDMPPEMDE